MHGAFLQSPEWEHIQRQWGRRTWRVTDILIVRHDLPFGLNYLYCARPHVDNNSLCSFLEQVRVIAGREKSIFLKIDPVETIVFDAMHVRVAYGTPLQPKETVILDLGRSADELMHAMHEKTRYNIRLAGRKDIDIIQSPTGDKEKDFEIFWNLLSETSSRNEFFLHEKEYYRILLDEQSSNFSTELFFATWYGGEQSALAVAMINSYHNPHTGDHTATYLHGGSSREHRELMAPYLLHWHIMENAKKRGIMQYDLWGIDEARWPGVTRFKKGFGGTRVMHPLSAHVIYRPMLYQMYEAIRK